MIELLISIMILGLGLTMVATVFPVGLDMTRDTVEKSLALAAADIALDILKLKLPTWHDEISNKTTNLYTGGTFPTPPIRVPVAFLPSPLVIPGDPYLGIRSSGATPLATSAMGIENDADITTVEGQILAGGGGFLGTPFYCRFDDGTTPPPAPVLLPELHDPAVVPATLKPQLVQHTRALTEQSTWDGDALQGSPANPGFSYVLSGQNVPIDYLSTRVSAKNPARPVLTPENPPHYVLPPLTVDYTSGARLHLSDQMYPPPHIPIARDSGTAAGTPTVSELANGFAAPAPTPAGLTRWEADRLLANLASNQRYSWSVVQHRLTQDRHFGVTVVVTSRVDLNAAFARQKDRRTGGPPPLGAYDLSSVGAGSPVDPATSVFLPVPVDDTQRIAAPPADDLQDGFYPRPWLVALGLPKPPAGSPTPWTATINNATGEALCTAEVARLLPSGSYCVVAVTVQSPPGVTAVRAGQILHVIASNYDPKNLSSATLTDPESETPTKLTLADKDSFGTVPISFPVYLWVFPPAIVAHPPNGTNSLGEFAGRSPVIAAFEREVTLP